MKTIKLNRYAAVVHVLAEKPEASIIVGHYNVPSYSADDLAEIVGCSKKSVGVYIRRMRQDGYDVRLNVDSEYYIQYPDNYCPEFRISLGKERDGHSLGITHNGHHWTSSYLGNLRELRQLHDTLGEYIDAVKEDYTK